MFFTNSFYIYSYNYIYRKDVLQLNAEYIDVGNTYKKLLKENIGNFTFCEVFVIAVFEWLRDKKYELPHLTVSYLHIYKINYNNNNTYITYTYNTYTYIL